MNMEYSGAGACLLYTSYCRTIRSILLAEALGRVDLSKVNLYANLEPNFWKISHGNDCISDVEAAAFEKRQVIVVRCV